jgi:hypothetical protein
MTALTEWQNFYVIVGSSAGALVGLQFVVLALIANMPGMQGQAQAGDAFVTPTIFHFGTVLLFAGLMSAPWHGILPVIGIWGLAGIIGVFYTVVVVLRLRQQTSYKPELEDWLFHAALPFLAYSVLIASAACGFSHVRATLFAVACTMLLLLLIGIHNAWDSVTYHVFVKKP